MSDQCPECKGRGTNPAIYHPAPCPDCRGTGYRGERTETDETESEDGMIDADGIYDKAARNG